MDSMAVFHVDSLEDKADGHPILRSEGEQMVSLKDGVSVSDWESCDEKNTGRKYIHRIHVTYIYHKHQLNVGKCTISIWDISRTLQYGKFLLV